MSTAAARVDALPQHDMTEPGRSLAKMTEGASRRHPSWILHLLLVLHLLEASHDRIVTIKITSVALGIIWNLDISLNLTSG